MTASISFLSGVATIQNLSGSGLGAYGAAGFGSSVRVGDYGDYLFVTDSTGVQQGPQCPNVKYLNAGSGILGQTGSGIALTAMPNYLASLQIRLQNSTPVKTQASYAAVYDRSNINNPPSGCIVQLANLIHPSVLQVNNGSGSAQWVNAAGSGSVLHLPLSPGVSGLYAADGNNGNWVDNTHDHYLGISMSPSQIGSLTQVGLYCYIEYL